MREQGRKTIDISRIVVYDGQGPRRSFVQESDIDVLADVAENAVYRLANDVNRDPAKFLRRHGKSGDKLGEVLSTKADDAMRDAMRAKAREFRGRPGFDEAISKMSPEGEEYSVADNEQSLQSDAEAVKQQAILRAESETRAAAEGVLMEGLMTRGLSREEAQTQLDAHPDLINPYIEAMQANQSISAEALANNIRSKAIKLAKEAHPELFGSRKEDKAFSDIAFEVALRDLAGSKYHIPKNQLSGRSKREIAISIAEGVEPGSVQRMVDAAVAEGATPDKARDKVAAKLTRDAFDNPDAPFLQRVAEMRKVIEEMIVLDKHGLGYTVADQKPSDVLRKFLGGAAMVAVAGLAISSGFGAPLAAGAAMKAGFGISLAGVGLHNLPIMGVGIAGMIGSRQMGEAMRGGSNGFVGALFRRSSKYYGMEYMQTHKLGAIKRKKPGTVPPHALRLAEVSVKLQAMRNNVVAMAAEFDEVSRSPSGMDELLTIGWALKMNNLKVNCAEAAPSIVHDALQIVGLSGYKNDSKFSVGRQYRDSLSANLMISNDRIFSKNASMLLVYKDE